MAGAVLRLGVNIDHVATLRQARGTTYPAAVEAAGVCQAAGAHGITVHLREDRRHIQDRDVYALKDTIEIPLNLEMANSPEIVRVAMDVRPAEVCLVPEKREELTTEGGLDVAGQVSDLGRTVAELAGAGIRVSLFIDPEKRQIEAAARVGAPCVELHTGTYCEAAPAGGAWQDSGQASEELDRLVSGAVFARECGLQVNAGHGLNLENLGGALQIPHLDTLNIGHSIVARAVFVGLDRAVKEMLEEMSAYSGGRDA
jgi:pyridoxine 5-phosphate synthase